MLSLCLSACAIWPPGEDQEGRDLKSRATPVLGALANYHKDRGESPSSLYELVPRYLKEVPFGPNFDYAPDRNLVGFIYSPSWPQTRQVECLAQLGALQWTCKGDD